jgi:hypothetical protein
VMAWRNPPCQKIDEELTATTKAPLAQLLSDTNGVMMQSVDLLEGILCSLEL